MVEINLLPAQYRKRSDPSLWRAASIGVPVLTVLGVLGFTVYQQARLGNLQGQLNENLGVISSLEPAKRESDDLNRQKSDLQKVTQVSSTLQASKTYWSSDLARFVNALPVSGGVALTNLTVRAIDSNAQSNLTQQGLYNGKAVSKEFELTGQAVSSQALVNFLNTFENNPNFGVNFKSAQKAVSTAAPGTAGPVSAPYTFNATVGLVGQATAASATTAAGVAGSAAAPAPTPGGNNVR